MIWQKNRKLEPRNVLTIFSSNDKSLTFKLCIKIIWIMSLKSAESDICVRPWTMDAQWSLFSLKSRSSGFGQTKWANKFWGIWGIFGWTISTHFSAVSPLSMFSIIQPLFLKKTKPLYPNSVIFTSQICIYLGFEFWL